MVGLVLEKTFELFGQKGDIVGMYLLEVVHHLIYKYMKIQIFLKNKSCHLLEVVHHLRLDHASVFAIGQGCSSAVPTT